MKLPFPVALGLLLVGVVSVLVGVALVDVRGALVLGGGLAVFVAWRSEVGGDAGK